MNAKTLFGIFVAITIFIIWVVVVIPASFAKRCFYEDNPEAQLRSCRLALIPFRFGISSKADNFEFARIMAVYGVALSRNGRTEDAIGAFRESFGLAGVPPLVSIDVVSADEVSQKISDDPFLRSIAVKIKSYEDNSAAMQSFVAAMISGEV